MSPEFWLTTLVATLVPGAGVVFTVAAALGGGVRGALVATVGCTLGLVPHALLAVSGVAVLLAGSRPAFLALTYAGVAYLLWMAYATWRHGIVPVDGVAPTGAARMIVDAVALNLLNPKLTVFFLALLPQFVDPDGPRPAYAQLLLLSAGAAAVTFVCFLGYGLLAAAGRTAVLRRPRVLTGLARGFAVCFAVLAVRLALA